MRDRVAELENWLDGRECWRCGYRVSGHDWKEITQFAPARLVRCVGCRGDFGDWRRHSIKELQEELGKRGGETCEMRGRAESAEQRVKELEEELIHNVNEAKRVESLSEENRKLRELIVYFYGGRFSSYWSELQEWKRTGATHAPGALVERDYEKAKELEALLKPSEAVSGGGREEHGNV